jgi:hypothetical protein
MSECAFILSAGQKYHCSFQEATRSAAKLFLIFVIMKSFLFCFFVFSSTGRIYRRGDSKQKALLISSSIDQHSLVFPLLFHSSGSFHISQAIYLSLAS